MAEAVIVDKTGPGATTPRRLLEAATTSPGVDAQWQNTMSWLPVG
jgi:hypothetical protein